MREKTCAGKPKAMRRKRAFPMLWALLFLCAAWGWDGCAAEAPAYIRIDQETAKQMMAAGDGHVVVAVRRQDEYDAGHIPGAILIPNESIGGEAPEALPDREQIILIYCRSGNRSRQAAQKLAELGYQHVYEFGGIMSWTGKVVTTEEENAGWEGFTEFYYTYDASTDPPHYQRYHFYTKNGACFLGKH